MCNNLSIFSSLCSVKNHFSVSYWSTPVHWFGFFRFISKMDSFQISNLFIVREQKVRARRNNKEMLKHEIQFMGSYHNVSRVKTSKVAEGENYFILTESNTFEKSQFQCPWIKIQFEIENQFLIGYFCKLFVKLRNTIISSMNLKSNYTSNRKFIP